MIDRHIRQIWIGELPTREADFCRRMESMNPEFAYTLHREELLRKYSNDPYIKSLISQNEPMAFVVDRLRVLLLRDEGGLYLDCDAEPIKPLSSIAHILSRPDVDFVTGMRNPWRPGVALHRGVALIDNTVLFSAKNGRVINRLCGLYRPESLIHNGHSHGVEVMRCLDETVVLLNYHYFYADEPTSESLILHDHQNLSSWSNRRPTLAAK